MISAIRATPSTPPRTCSASNLNATQADTNAPVVGKERPPTHGDSPGAILGPRLPTRPRLAPQATATRRASPSASPPTRLHRALLAPTERQPRRLASQYCPSMRDGESADSLLRRLEHDTEDNHDSAQVDQENSSQRPHVAQSHSDAAQTSTS